MKRLVLLVPLVVAAGCGGGTKTVIVRPKLPRPLASELRAKVAAVESALAANDGCTAHARALALRSAVVAAVNHRRVPRPFQETLRSAVNQLPPRITCTPPPAPTPTPAPAPPHPHPPHPPHGHPHGHGHGKGHGR